ncbi:MAG TPA: D-alanyl-D-alanine carboxypeptidase family protein, partial [Salinisphaeraceae bacterium]|nr:D-alanyl-D-alanine carboxypeptidase family protein [Salinisphaeraceae bacterium]
FALGLLFCMASLAVAKPLPIPDPPSIHASSYILIEAKSGQTLAGANENKPVEPASITKLMTTYIAFDAIAAGELALDDMVNVSEKAWRTGGSSMFIEVGTQVSVEQLLHGIITASGNDATVALAEHIAGSESAFADYMNQYAKELGMVNSHFVNSTGWPAENHRMSAHDMARVLIAIIHDFPDLYGQFFQQEEFTYNNITQMNRNSLLWSDPSVDGGKTGHTEAAGYGLAASAKRENVRLVSVVTGAASENARISASRSLLNYGFRFFETGQLFGADEPVTELRIWKGDSKMLPVVAKGAVHIAYPRGTRDQLSTSAELPQTLMAPVEQGQKLGTLKIKYGNETLQTIPLYAGETVAKGGIVHNLVDEVLLLFN